jgi:hypothetical protein
MATYTIQVTFTRELEDDANVLKSTPQKVTDKQLLQQFRRELQGAYDATGMAGRFEIGAVTRK